MLRFEPKDGKTYQRKPLKKIVFLILIAAVFINDFSMQIVEIKQIGFLVRFCCILVILRCIWYIIIKLLERAVNRPEFGSPNYLDEFIEVYEDHIRICEFSPVIAKQKYDLAEIYFEDIEATWIYRWKVKIVLVSKPTKKTRIKRAGNHKYSFILNLDRYPTELIELLFGEYRQQMKVVQS